MLLSQKNNDRYVKNYKVKNYNNKNDINLIYIYTMLLLWYLYVHTYY